MFKINNERVFFFSFQEKIVYNENVCESVNMIILG